MAAAKKKQTASAPTADMTAGVEPTVRIFTRWTPELIRSAAIQADGGYLRPAANLCDWLLTDDRVSSTLRTRVQTLLGLEPDFEKSGDKRRSGKALKALEVEEDWDESYPESELSQLVSWGLLLGVKPARHAWTKNDEHGGRLMPMPECWHPQHLRFDNPTRTWRINVATSGTGGEQERELTPGDGEWILHTPFGKNRPWSFGLWRALAPLVLLKEYARQDWAKISERGIMLVLTCLDAKAATELQGYTKDARKKLAEDIYARGSQAVAALPPGIDLKAVQAVLNAKDIQGALIALADDAIAIVIRGGNLTTNVKQGSKAATESQADLGDGGNLRFDAASLTTTIHGQSLKWWAQFNYGDPSLAPWPVYPVGEDEDVKTKAEAQGSALGNLAVAERLGLDVDRGSFLEEHKITWAKAGTRDDAKAPLPSTWRLAPAAAPPTPPEPKPALPEPGSNVPPEEDDQSEEMPNAEAAKSMDELTGKLQPHARVVVVGGPRTGKSTLSVRSGERYRRTVRHGDSLVGKLDWSASSEEVSRWLDEPGDWVIEGVVAVRAIRKWLEANPDKPLDATVVYLRDPIQVQTKKQQSMTKGIATMWNQVRGDLAARGCTIIERDA